MQMKKIFLVSSFLLANFAILLVAFYMLALGVTRKNQTVQANPIISSSYDSFSAVPESPTHTEVNIIASDARAKLVDFYFARYQSPMAGLGEAIVTTADKYNLPFGLVPAIAMCEGNLGKVIPVDSYNTYGWGIYGEKITRFASWEDGIEKVSRGLRQDYLNKGLTTPDQIMKKYTPGSNGSWAFCVDKFLGELK